MNRKKFLKASLAGVTGGFSTTISRLSSVSSKDPIIIRPGKNRSGTSLKKFMEVHENDVIISRKDTLDELSVFYFRGLKGASTSLHVHLYPDEFLYVLRGKYQFDCGQMQEDLCEGDTIFYPGEYRTNGSKFQKKEPCYMRLILPAP